MTEDEFRTGNGPKRLPDGATIRTKLNQVTAVASTPGNAHADDYMRGMANGLILAEALANGVEPVYVEADKVFDYMREADKTCSIVFNPQYVARDEVLAILSSVIGFAEDMNIMKKLFFRGRTPEELGLGGVPTFDVSMGPQLQEASEGDINIIHGIVGVITEAGEMAELLKAYFEGKPFDRVHVLEEAGDVNWYLARQLRGIDATRDMMDKANIDKLHGRHGEAFDVFRDANRNLEAERAKLETIAAPLLEYGKPFDDKVQRFETTAGLPPLAAIPPRVRNDPPLPPGVSVGSNGGENIGEGTVEYRHKRNVGDCEGMDC